MTNSQMNLPKNRLRRAFRALPFILLCLSIVFLWVTKDDNKIIEQKSLKKTKNKTVPKYILLWNAHNYAPFYYLGEGSDAFKKCPVSNCFVTSDKKFFNNLTKFDAVGFNGRSIGSLMRSGLPQDRSPHQKYIFFNMESAENYIVCNRQFDGFFNWTATYKLNSDIVTPYVLIKNAKGEEVGPKKDMTWKVFNASDNLAKFKSKSIMWLASNCYTKSNREILVRILETELEPFHTSIDKFGACGKFKCPKSNCQDTIKKYFFYLSFENSFADDYVTEKIYSALNNGVIPVVLGGADYSRFLPPGSYLDATKLSPQELASTMVDIIENPIAYNKFFWWRHYYTYHKPESFENVCKLCAALNNKTMLETRTVYNDFRRWWNPNYLSQCTRRKRETTTQQDKAKLWLQLFE